MAGWYLALVSLAGVAAVAPALAVVDIGLGRENDLGTKVARGAGYETKNVGATTLSESVGKVIKAALGLVGTIFLALTIYAGFLWMTASGNEEQVTKAQNIIQRASLGLIIVLAAYGLTVFVLVAITSAAGQSTGQIGGDIGAKGFWSSFGQQFKDNWYKYAF